MKSILNSTSLKCIQESVDPATSLRLCEGDNGSNLQIFASLCEGDNGRNLRIFANFARKMTAFSTHPQDSIFWGMVEEPINWLFEGGVSNIFNNIGYGFIASFPTPPKFASKLAAQFLLIIALCFLTPPKFASLLANLPSREWEGYSTPLFHWLCLLEKQGARPLVT